MQSKNKLNFREGLPMTMKSCFYPLIGNRIFGWMGDTIDVVSIITTLFGVCTSLGLGTRQLNTGLNMVNSDIPNDNITVQVPASRASFICLIYFILSYVFLGHHYLVHNSSCHYIHCNWSWHGNSKTFRSLLWSRNVPHDSGIVLRQHFLYP